VTTYRYVSLIPGTGTYTGTHISLGGQFDGGYTFTRVRVSAKFNFPAITGSSYTTVGQWGHTISFALNGATPPNWETAPGDPSILAFDFEDPDGLERVFWSPDSDTVQVVPASTKTIEWRGQLHTDDSDTIGFWYFGNAWESATPDFRIDLAYQIWYAD
jgi:hypothetical protein